MWSNLKWTSHLLTCDHFPVFTSLHTKKRVINWIQDWTFNEINTSAFLNKFFTRWWYVNQSNYLNETIPKAFNLTQPQNIKRFCPMSFKGLIEIQQNNLLIHLPSYINLLWFQCYYYYYFGVGRTMQLFSDWKWRWTAFKKQRLSCRRKNLDGEEGMMPGSLLEVRWAETSDRGFICGCDCRFLPSPLQSGILQSSLPPRCLRSTPSTSSFGLQGPRCSHCGRCWKKGVHNCGDNI